MISTCRFWVQSLAQEDLLEKEMATHSSILAWEVPWMEEPDRPQSIGSHRVRHDCASEHKHMQSPAYLFLKGQKQ